MVIVRIVLLLWLLAPNIICSTGTTTDLIEKLVDDAENNIEETEIDDSNEARELVSSRIPVLDMKYLKYYSSHIFHRRKKVLRR